MIVDFLNIVVEFSPAKEFSYRNHCLGVLHITSPADTSEVNNRKAGWLLVSKLGEQIFERTCCRSVVMLIDKANR
jgi:hypothetical protein